MYSFNMARARRMTSRRSVHSILPALLLLYHRRMTHPTHILISSAEAAPLLAEVKVVYTDLDGTLLAPGGRLLTATDGSPSARTAQALVALAERGVHVVPVSGRNRVQLSELSRLLAFDGFMAEMGTVSVQHDDGRTLVSYDTGVWPSDILDDRTPYERIEASGAVEALLDTFAGRLEPHLPWTDNRECTHLFRGSVPAAEAADVLSRFDLPMTLLDNGTIHPRNHSLSYEGDVHAYHLLPKGTSKAAAISRDMTRRGLSAGEAIAIGDSFADVAMGEATGLLVMMSNALENKRVLEALSARNLTTMVTTHRSADGWVEFAACLLESLRA